MSQSAMSDRPTVERRCGRAGCESDAVATLTFDYRDALAALGPLALRPEPHAHDLCARHAERLSVPNGWQVIRHVVLAG